MIHDTRIGEPSTLFPHPLKNSCAKFVPEPKAMGKDFQNVRLIEASRFELITSQLSEFKRGRIIGLKEGSWANQRISRHMGRSDAAIRRFWQEWVDNGIFQSHDNSSRSRATADREDRLIVRSDVTVPDSSLSTIRRGTRARVFSMTIQRQLIERNLPSYRPLRLLPLMPVHCVARLQ
ncbi:HTH_Tnp_Tc3_2 domain-containing protein [Trichonephila clavipes]|nr:HTH_Tnp_Tc3_2 domain-containing protein [Trichonephila clavipes]